MEIGAVGSHVIIRRIENKAVGGIILPTAEKDNFGEIVSVDDETFDKGLAPGDKVYFNKHAALEIVHNGESLLALRYNDIQAVVK